MSQQPEDRIAEFAAQLRATRSTYPAAAFSGRGIVIAAGGAQIFTNAYVLVSVLRRILGCTLPVEVWHFGAQEMSNTMAQLLREFDVAVVDAFPRIAREGATVGDGWQLKPFALTHSSFAEVLMLDADQVPVRDPAPLFETPQYREAGALFWPDIVGLRRDNPVWAALSLQPLDPERSLESGQILIDKRRHWRALTLANEISQRLDLVYQYVYGDKDVFLLAWLLAGEEYSLVPHQPMVGNRCLVQRDFDGHPLFQHRTNGKFAYSTDEPPTAGMQHIEACNEALRELRRRWNGRIFWPPDRSLRAREFEDALGRQGRFMLEVMNAERSVVELLPFGEFGEGRSHYRQNWWCEEEAGRIALLFRDDERITYRLKQQQDGSWKGRRLSHGEATAELSPLVEQLPAPHGPGLVDDLLAATGFPSPSPGAWEKFAGALELISQVDPSVLERLNEIAAEFPPPAATRLSDLSAAIAATRTVHPPHGRTGTLKKSYRRLDDDEPI